MRLPPTLTLLLLSLCTLHPALCTGASGALLHWSSKPENNTFSYYKNWIPAQTPSAPDTVVFGNSTTQTDIKLSGTTTLAAITFDARNSTTSKTLAYTLNLTRGSTLNLNGNITDLGYSSNLSVTDRQTLFLGSNSTLNITGDANTNTALILSTNSRTTYSGNTSAGNPRDLTSNSTLNYNNATILINTATSDGNLSSTLRFTENATSAAANITNIGSNATTLFDGNSTAGILGRNNTGSSTIYNNAGSTTRFTENAQTASATLRNAEANTTILIDAHATIGQNITNGQTTLYNTGLNANTTITGNTTIASLRLYNNGNRASTTITGNTTATAAAITLTNNGNNSTLTLSGNSSINTATNSTFTNNGANATLTITGDTTLRNLTLTNNGNSSTLILNGNSSLTTAANITNNGNSSLLRIDDNARIHFTTTTRSITNNGNSSTVHITANTALFTNFTINSAANTTTLFSANANATGTTLNLADNATLQLDLAEGNPLDLKKLSFTANTTILFNSGNSTAQEIILGRDNLPITALPNFAELNNTAGSITKVGSSTLTIDRPLNITGNYNHTNGTTTLAHTHGLATATLNLLANGFTLAPGNSTYTIAALAGNSTLDLSANLILGNYNPRIKQPLDTLPLPDRNTLFTGTLTGAGNITKNSTDTQTFQNADLSAHTGSLTVNGGHLILDNTVARNATVQNRAILSLRNNPNFTGNTTAIGSSTLVLQNTTHTGNITLETTLADFGIIDLYDLPFIGSASTRTAWSAVATNGSSSRFLIYGAPTLVLSNSTYTKTLTINSLQTLNLGLGASTLGDLTLNNGGLFSLTINKTSTTLDHGTLTLNSLNFSPAEFSILYDPSSLALADGDTLANIFTTPLGNLTYNNATLAGNSTLAPLRINNTLRLTPFATDNGNSTSLSFTANTNTLAELLRNPTPNQLAIVNSLDTLLQNNPASDLAIIANYINPTELPRLTSALAPSALTNLYRLAYKQTDTETRLITQRLATQQHARNLLGNSTALRIESAQLNLNIPTSSLLASTTPTPGTSTATANNGNSTTDENSYTAYAALTATGGTTDSDNNAQGSDYKLGGLTIGLDRPLGNNDGLAGIQFTYHYGKTDLDQSPYGETGNSTANSYRLAAYLARVTPTNTHWFQTHLAASYHQYDSTRTILGTPSTATPHALGLAASIELGKHLNPSKKSLWKHGPYLRLTYDYLRLDSFTETNPVSAFNLDYPTQSNDSLRTHLGWKFTRDYTDPSTKTTYLTDIRIAWAHEFCDPDGSIQARFAETGASPFTVTGTSTSRESLQASLALQSHSPRGRYFSLSLALDANPDYQDISLTLSLGQKF